MEETKYTCPKNNKEEEEGEEDEEKEEGEEEEKEEEEKEEEGEGEEENRIPTNANQKHICIILACLQYLELVTNLDDTQG